MNRELPDIQVGFRKGREPEVKLSTFVESQRKQGFSGGSVGEESACNVGDLGSEDRLEEGMATHSSILAWGIPIDRGTWWAVVRGVAKSWT